MYKKLLLILFCSLPVLLFAQTIEYFGDTVDFKPGRRSVNAEIRLRNATRNIVGGALVNRGGGLLAFRKVLTKVNDSTYLILDDTLHLPTFLTGIVQAVSADWNANSGPATILNKPNLSPVALSNDYNDLNNKPTFTGSGDTVINNYYNGGTVVNDSHDTLIYHNTFAAGLDTSIIVNVADKFGFNTIDSTADNYAQFQAFATWLNARGGYASLYFKPGIYHIGQVRQINPLLDTIVGEQDTTATVDTSSTASYAANSIKKIVFRNLKNVKIYGNNAKIDVKGDYYRAYTHRDGTDRYKESGYNQVVPFVFVNCDNLTVADLELDGNNEQMTQAPGVKEGDGNGMEIRSCTNVELNNLKIHHFQTDNLYIECNNSSSIIPENIEGNNLILQYAGRQAMTCTAKNATFNNCQFTHTRDTLGGMMGAYKGYAPGLGVDIEPNYSADSMRTKAMNIQFVGCRFTDNTGGALHTALTKRVSDVSVEWSVIDNSKYLNPFPIIGAVMNFNVYHNTFNMGKSPLRILYMNSGVKQQSATWSYNKINSNSEGILVQSATGPDYPIAFENNTVGGRHDSTFTGIFPWIDGIIEHRNNTYYFDSGLYTGSGPKAGRVLNLAVNEGNRYISEMPDTNTANTYHISFVGTNAINEYFATATAVRPTGADNYFANGGTTFNNSSIPLGKEQEINLGGGNILKVYWLPAFPAAGTYKVGDRINITDPSGDVDHYTCTVSGTIEGGTAQFKVSLLSSLQ